MDRNRLLALMERVARPLRRAGLARQVSALRKLLDRRMSPTWVEVDGLQMLGTTVGHLAHLRAWQEGREEALMTRLFTDAVTPGATVLDVGGYLGYFTLLAARAAGPQGRVITVEANPQSQELLTQSIERNGFGGRVTLHRAAVGAQPGTATFYADADDGSQSGLARPEHLGRSYEVEVATIDALVAGATPDLVKIDIEGGEAGALAGMRETLPRVAKLFIELNPDALARAGSSGGELLGELRAAGFAINVIDEATQSLRALGPDEGLSTHANLYCEASARS